METWEREGIARCRACAREFAQIQRMAEDWFAACDFLLEPTAEEFWRALDDAMASPLAADIDARCSLYPPNGGNVVMLTSTPGISDGWFAERFIPGPVQLGNGYFPGGVTIRDAEATFEGTSQPGVDNLRPRVRALGVRSVAREADVPATTLYSFCDHPERQMGHATHARIVAAVAKLEAGNG